MLAKIQEIINKNSDVKTLLEKIEPGTFGSSYVKSYESIIDFFNDIQLNENSLIQGAHMVYGWMPTILNITKHDLDTQNVLLSVEKISKEIFFIDSWFMSCRVLKRGMENFVLNTIVSFAKNNGSSFLKGEYLPTPKNDMVKDHYKNLGFEEQENYWFLNLTTFEPKKTFIQNK